MNGYREFWNTVIFGNDGIGPISLERYWLTMGLLAAIFLAVGIASMRLRLVAPAVTIVMVAAYVISLVPFIVWTASCTGCGASYSYDAARSGELVFIHIYWSAVFATGVAALWIGVLLSQGVKAILARRPSPRPSATPLPGGEGPGVRA
jgi:hypothetical protein